MKTFFATTRHWYDSYTDWVALINEWAARDPEHRGVCYVDQIDVTLPHRYIVSPINGEFRPHIESREGKGIRHAKIHWWNLERLPVDENHEEHRKGLAALYERYIDGMIVSDKWFEKYYEPFADKVHFCPVGGAPCLEFFPREKRTADRWDVALLAYLWGRRTWLQHALPNVAPNGWKDERVEILRRSKIMAVNHQDQYPLLEPLRFILAVCNHLPIVSEHCEDPFPYDKTDALFCDYRQTPATVRDCLNDMPAAEERAARAYAKMTGEYSFENCIGKLLTKLDSCGK